MIRSKSIIPVIALLLVFPAIEISGQDPLTLDEIKVVAPYEPSISDAFKISLNPRIEDTLDVKLQFTYNIPPQKIITRFEPEPVSPARMRGEPLSPLSRLFVKGGYGNYSTPYFEGFYNSLRSNTGSLSLRLKHRSSGGGIPDVGHNAYSDNFAALTGQRFFSNYTLGASIDYKRNVLHYYGFKREDFENEQPVLDLIDSLTNDDLRQKFDQLSAGISFGSHQTDSTRIRTQNSIGYKWLADTYAVREHQVSYRGYLGRNILADPFGFADKQHISLNLQADYLHNESAADTSGTYLIGLQPKLWSGFHRFRFHIGVNAIFQVDTVSYFRAYPIVGAELDIVRNRLIAFIQLSGNTERHSVLTLRESNPFINTNAGVSYMNIKSDIGGGFKGALGEMIGFSLSVNRAHIDQHPFFVNDTSAVLKNRFSLVYDDVSRFHFRGNLATRFGERFSAMFTANHYQYAMTDEPEAWHTPMTTLSGSLAYNFKDKIILTTDIYARSESYGRTFDDNGLPIASIAHPFHTDLNFGIEYRYTKKLSVFLNFSNVMNQSLDRWMNVPSQGFNFLGGATFAL